MSLGYLGNEIHVRKQVGDRSSKLPSVIEVPPVAAPAQRRVAAYNVCGKRSIFTLCGWCSCGSIFAVLSSLSVASIGSFASVASIGSTWSVLSLGSMNSFLSVGSYGCSMRMFANCDRSPKDNGVAFDIHLNESTWGEMQSCRFGDYQQFKRYDPNDSPCDYKKALCAYRRAEASEMQVNCKVRRKGFSTFQNMHDRPSFNVKFYNEDWTDKKKIALGSFHGVAIETDKIRLNNMAYSNSWSGLTEVDAYNAFRSMGYPDMPIATDITLSTYKGGALQRKYGAALIEVLNGEYFDRTGYGADYVVLEVDITGTELKKVKGAFKDDISPEFLEGLVNREVSAGDWMPAHKLLMDAMSGDAATSAAPTWNASETLMYYVGERLTRSWDGACLRHLPNNFYVIAWIDVDGVTRARYMPKGLDRVFEGCTYDLLTSSRQYCGPVQASLENFDDAGTNATTFDDFYAERAALVPHKGSTCGEDVGVLTGFVLVSVLVSLVLLLVVAKCTAYLMDQEER